MPTPRPETSVADERVLKPGWKIEIEQLLVRPVDRSRRGRDAPLDGDRAQHLRIDAAAVVFQRDEDAIALLLGRQDRAGRRAGLPMRSRSAGVSMP